MIRPEAEDLVQVLPRAVTVAVYLSALVGILFAGRAVYAWLGETWAVAFGLLVCPSLLIIAGFILARNRKVPPCM